MRRGKSQWRALFTVPCAAPLLVLFLVGLAYPQASFFQGKSVTIIQASAPGGVGDMRTKALVPNRELEIARDRFRAMVLKRKTNNLTKR